MNKSFKSVWNASTGTWVATSELTKACGKKSRTVRRLSAVAVLSALASGAHAGTLDGGSVASYSANDQAYGSGAQAISSSNTVSGATAIGMNAYANNYDGSVENSSGTVAVGPKAYAFWGSTAIGGTSTASGTRSTAIGAASLANANAATVRSPTR